jgi:hypothetical protein
MEPFNYFDPKALKLKFYKITEKQHNDFTVTVQSSIYFINRKNGQK